MIKQYGLDWPDDFRDWDIVEQHAYASVFSTYSQATDWRVVPNQATIGRVIYHPVVVADGRGARELVLQMEHGRRPTTIDTIGEEGAFAMARRLNEKVRAHE